MYNMNDEIILKVEYISTFFASLSLVWNDDDVRASMQTRQSHLIYIICIKHQTKILSSYFLYIHLTC